VGRRGLPAGYKARWVAKGYSQLEGIDYTDLYAGVAHKDSILVFLSLVSHFNLECDQVDIVAAFLNWRAERHHIYGSTGGLRYTVQQGAAPTQVTLRSTPVTSLFQQGARQVAQATELRSHSCRCVSIHSDAGRGFHHALFACRRSTYRRQLSLRPYHIQSRAQRPVRVLRLRSRRILPGFQHPPRPSTAHKQGALRPTGYQPRPPRNNDNTHRSASANIALGNAYCSAYAVKGNKRFDELYTRQLLLFNPLSIHSCFYMHQASPGISKASQSLLSYNTP
jgi:hypothetical protein